MAMHQSEYERIITTIGDTTKELNSPSFQDLIEFIATPKGQVFMEAYRESQYLTLEELQDLRQHFTAQNTITIINCLIREREQQTA